MSYGYRKSNDKRCLSFRSGFVLDATSCWSVHNFMCEWFPFVEEYARSRRVIGNAQISRGCYVDLPQTTLSTSQCARELVGYEFLEKTNSVNVFN